MRVRHRGFSLVELMVGLVVGLIVIAAVIAVFIGSRQTYQEIQRVTRLQENLRFVTYFMTKDLRRASYNNGLVWGDLSAPDVPEISFTENAFTIEWREDDEDELTFVDRDCVGDEIEPGSKVRHVYDLNDGVLLCTRFIGDGDDDFATTALMHNVTYLQAQPVPDAESAVGIAITLRYVTAIGNETFNHETEFRVGFRNQILNRID